MKKILLKSATLLITIIGIFLCAQTFANPASMNPSFDRGTPIGFNGGIYTQAVQDNGKLIIGGNFTSYQGVVTNRIIRLNADGTNDYSFDIGSGFDGIVRKILIQIDGKILIGGNFHTYNGIPANQLIRLNSDGSRDDTFDSGTGLGGSALLYALAIQDDGKIVVGGDFTSYKGVSAERLLRLNTDGSRDNTFDIIDGFDNTVKAILIQNDGKIVVGGMFSFFRGSGSTRSCSDTQYTDQVSCESVGSCSDGVSLDQVTCEAYSCDDGVSLDEISCGDNGGNWGQWNTWTMDNTRIESKEASRIVRLNSDGSRDLDFHIGNGFNANVTALALQDDEKIIVGGAFTLYHETDGIDIMRLNTNGSADTGFVSGGGFNEIINDIAIQDDGKIVIGGLFTAYSGAVANRVVRLHTNGTIDTGFLMGIGFNSLVIQSGGKLLVGGTFTTYNGVAVSRITRLNGDGTKDPSFAVGNGFDNEIKAIIAQADGKIIAGGTFISYNGIVTNKIVRIHTDGTADTGFLMGNGFNNTVSTLAIQNDGKILVGGAFTTYSGTTVNRIVRLNTDGTIDNSFIIGSGFNNTINTIAIQDNSKIIIGGSFTTYNGTTANRIIRLNSNGSIDTGFFMGNGFPGNVQALAIQDDGKIIVGGSFTTYSGTTANKIVRTNSDGTIDTGFLIGNSFGGPNVAALAIQNDEKIVVGGNFSTYQGAPAVRIIRLNTDGSRDTDFVTNSGFSVSVNTLAIQDNGKILVGGAFTTYKSLPANRIICLYSDGIIDPNFDVGSGFNNTVNTITIKNNKEIVVGGLFTTYQNQADPYIASLYGDSDLVILPNSSDTTIMKNEFTSKGYVQSGGDLVGSNAISLSQTSGYIPTTLNLKNQNIQLDIQADTQFKEADNTTNYTGIISMPATKSIESINDENVVTAFNIGSQELLYLSGGIATLSVNAPSGVIGDMINIYYSEDNGVTRYPQTQTFVTENNGAPYISFTTSHFTDFAATLPQSSMTGLFTINNDAASTFFGNVTLNVSTTPEAMQMRFSNDGITRSNWAGYTATAGWTIFTGETSVKTVYAEFDRDNDDTADISINDSIFYIADDESPVITLNGSGIINTVYGNTYTELGATWIDNVDGTGTANLSGTVNTGLVGIYTIEYFYIDNAGNTGNAFRTVNVIASTPPVTPPSSPSGGNGDGSPSLIKDQCPVQRDCSDSYYDTLCGKCSLIEKIVHVLPFHGATNKPAASILGSLFSLELNNAYLRAYGYDITTMPTIQKANMQGSLLRKDMAKMISNFAINVLGKTVSTGATCTFTDMKSFDKTSQYYAMAACRLGLMGYASDGVTMNINFNPEQEVDRAQFGTILSRLLRGTKYAGGNPYYS
ncbi:MAG: DUF5011 domain-containing protein, partial [candidate division SR1 bacterium]|nr:DUF5011 domain-containing protein [candidate division SR1 bacterium]